VVVMIWAGRGVVDSSMLTSARYPIRPNVRVGLNTGINASWRIRSRASWLDLSHPEYKTEGAWCCKKRLKEQKRYRLFVGWITVQNSSTLKMVGSNEPHQYPNRGYTIEKLHHDEGLAVLVPDVIDGADIGMV
jgi:hypothetical protein